MHESLMGAAVREAARLVREEGIPPSVAVGMAADAAVEIHRGSPPARGPLGAVTEALKDAAASAPVAAVREAVSPWLWVLSLVSFGMAVTNYQRVGKMFGSWQKRRRRI